MTDTAEECKHSTRIYIEDELPAFQYTCVDCGEVKYEGTIKFTYSKKDIQKILKEGRQ